MLEVWIWASAESRPSAWGWLAFCVLLWDGCNFFFFFFFPWCVPPRGWQTHQTVGTWRVAHVYPVRAVVSVEVLAAVFVETATSTTAVHVEDGFAVAGLYMVLGDEEKYSESEHARGHVVLLLSVSGTQFVELGREGGSCLPWRWSEETEGGP